MRTITTRSCQKEKGMLKKASVSKSQNAGKRKHTARTSRSTFRSSSSRIAFCRAAELIGEESRAMRRSAPDERSTRISEAGICSCGFESDDASVIVLRCCPAAASRTSAPSPTSTLNDCLRRAFKFFWELAMAPMM